jgi:hypothetical protein
MKASEVAARITPDVLQRIEAIVADIQE